MYRSTGSDGIVSAQLAGKLTDQNSRITARRGGTFARKSRESLPELAIEKSRLLLIFLMLPLSVFAVANYGWAL